MEDARNTAWWVRRLGAAAVLASLAFSLGGIAAHSDAPLPESGSRQSAGTHYGPNPAYRLTPQINRIIRVAQRSKRDEEKKGGGTQFKSPPVQKKTAPPPRKKAPVIKKKAPAPKKTAPVRKKVPVLKKKAPPREKTAPPKKKAPVPKKEVPQDKSPPAQKAPPAKKTPPPQKAPPTQKAPPMPPPTPGGTPDQQQENADYCRANPNSPKCAPAEKAPPTEKAPPAEKEPPAGEMEPQPGPGRPDEDAGGVGSICEQNPQLPQCQVERPGDTPPPPGPDGTDAPPGFPPPGAPPVPPGSPPPPPSDTDDGSPPAPSGPQIQSVSECPAGQRLSIIGECFTPCPEGQSWYAGPGIYRNTCVDECPDSDGVANGYVDDGTGQCRQCAGGMTANGECQCDAHYVESQDPNAYSICEPCNGVIYEGQCIAECPQGTLYNSGYCAAECPEEKVQGEGLAADACVPRDCPEGTLREFDRCVEECGQGYDFVSDGQCLTQCPGSGLADANGQCVDQCPEGQVEYNGTCLSECPNGTTAWDEQCIQQGNCPEGEVQYTDYDQSPPADACGTECPEGLVARLGVCIGQPACSTQGGTVYNMEQCVEQCPEAALTFNGRCFDQCPEGVADLGDGTCGACPTGEFAANGVCSETCPGGTFRHLGQCVAECPAPYAPFGISCIVEGNCPEGELQSGNECIPRDECLENSYMVERSGACIGWSSCRDSGGVIVDRVCLEQCPAGQEQLGSGCSTPCPEGQDRVGDECVGTCPTGQSWQDGQCADVQCAEGEEVVGSQCLAPCAEGEVRQGNVCVPAPCENAEVRMNGVCTAQDEIPYEDFIDQCLSDLEQLPYEVPPDLAGDTPRETCESLIDDLCDGLQGDDGDRASDVQACLERPCAEGQENVAGLCVAPCAADQERDGDGQCIAACSEGQERGPDGQCAMVPCTEEQVTLQDGSCVASCPDGQEAVNAQCVPVCPAGAERDANGLCPGECPEGQRMGLNGQCQSCATGLEVVNGECVAACMEGVERDANGACQSSCPEDQVIASNGACRDRCSSQGWTTEYDGRCVADCPEGEMLYQGQCQQMEMCPDGTYQRMGRDAVCQDECTGDQVAVNTTEGAQCRYQCNPHLEEVDGVCVAACPWGQERGADGQCSNPCPGDQVLVRGGTCREPCAEGYVLMVDITGGACLPASQCSTQYDGMCVPAARSPEDAIELCINGSYLGSSNRDQASCEEALAAYCAEKAAPERYGVVPPECLVSETMPANEEEAAEDEVPPAEDDATPPTDDATPPSEEPPAEQEPTEEQQPPQEPCPDGQVRLGGSCQVPAEIPRDEFIEECEAGGFPLPPDLAGSSPEEACGALVESICEGEAGSSNFPSDSRVCTDGAPPPADEQQPPAEEQPPTEEQQPPAEEQPPAEQTTPPEDEAPPPAEDETPPPPEDETPPPAEEEPPPTEETPPPAEDETPPPLPSNGGSICEQNPQLPQCQDQDADEDAPPPPPTDGAPPPPPPGSPPPPIEEPSPGGAPAPTPSPEAKTPVPSKPSDTAKAAALPVAVVIAIDDYDNKALSGSPQAIANAAHLVRFLKGDLGMDDTRIITGRNAGGAEFEDIFGRVGGAKSELGDLLKDREASELIVYYAGQARALDGGGEVLLLPADADPAKTETGVKLSALYDRLAALGIEKLRFYLDPSFIKDEDVVEIESGPRIGLFGLFTPRHWVTLSATSDTSEVGDAQRQRSLFIESLVAGLRGIADSTGEGDGDGTVSAKELHEFTRDQAVAAAKRGAKVPMPSLYGKSGETLRTY